MPHSSDQITVRGMRHDTTMLAETTVAVCLLAADRTTFVRYFLHVQNRRAFRTEPAT